MGEGPPPRIDDIDRAVVLSSVLELAAVSVAFAAATGVAVARGRHVTIRSEGTRP